MEEYQQVKHVQNQKGTEKELKAHPENAVKHFHDVEKFGCCFVFMLCGYVVMWLCGVCGVCGVCCGCWLLWLFGTK